jgi:threonine aldolase
VNTNFIVDLRSDTVTKPTPAMRRAMAEAEVGDDVFGDDPTVNRLQEKVAALLGKEAAVYMPSGTMTNQTAIRAQTEPGDEIICHSDSHIYNYEGGAPCALSGCSLRLLEGPHGQFDAGQVRAAIRDPNNVHFPRTRLIVVENTQNRGGGSIWPLDRIAAIRKVADENGIAMHLDGARLMNACVATGLAPTDYTRCFETVSTCFSKGLGAPIGSAVAGTAEMVKRIRRFRKMLGGGMRQAGIVAAAAIYALDHHVERLAEDHANARRLAEAIDEMPDVSIRPEEVVTNILYFDVDPSIGTAAEFRDRLRAEGVWVNATGPQRIRAVTHLDVNAAGIDRAISVMRRLLSA